MIGLWTEGLTDLPKTIGLASASLTSTLILPICTKALEAKSKSRENGGCASRGGPRIFGMGIQNLKGKFF